MHFVTSVPLSEHFWWHLFDSLWAQFEWQLQGKRLDLVL